jgi:hypothetical protein
MTISALFRPTLCLALAAIAAAAAPQPSFVIETEVGDHLNVLYGERLIGRYMCAYDQSRLQDTYKPYLHVFDREGKTPITKGPGGRFTHHRGLFIGWNKLKCSGVTYDRWHMKGGEQVHQKFLARQTNSNSASFTSLVHWNDNAEKPLLVERRTTTFRTPPEPAYVLIDFASTLQAVAGDLTLDGDPEHAGVQYRPANELVTQRTRYFFPVKGADPKRDVDYPWVGQTYVLNGKTYSVLFMNHPDNPKQTRFSAYRDYGRFGAFPKILIKNNETATVKYRLLIAEGAMPELTLVQQLYNAYAGGAD